jgi:hypothetical protein
MREFFGLLVIVLVEEALGLGVEAEIPFHKTEVFVEVSFRARTFRAFGLKTFPTMHM